MPKPDKHENHQSGALFERLQGVDRLPAGGLVERIEATAQERRTIAAALGIEALDSLTFDFELKPAGRGRLRLSGRVDGEARQACVVTLDPITQRVSEPVAMELWPAAEIERAAGGRGGGEVEIALEGPEPYDGCFVDVGQIAYEVFASALDPYPRKPGAAFEWSQPEQDREKREASPFAALKTLKRP